MNSLFVNSLGAWDLLSFLRNAKNYTGRIFAGVIALIGLALLGWGGTMLAIKLFNPEKSRTNWFIIILMIIVGGAMGIGGGWSLLQSIGGGGEKTIRDLGGGVILP